MGILTLCKITTLTQKFRSLLGLFRCTEAQWNRGDEEADYSTNSLTIARSQTAGGDPYPPSVVAPNLQEFHSNQ
jgi:hypothetical protein